MTPPVNPHDLRARIEADLRGNILPFWIERVANRPTGTFHGRIDHAGVIDPAAERGALLTARILWTYARAFRHYGEPAYREMAAFAHADLMGRHHDAVHGGFFWSLHADGSLHRDRKHVYGQAFAIYGLAEYHAATGDGAVLAQAVDLFHRLERHARDRRHGGYFEAFARDWVPTDDLSLGGGDRRDPKSQNTMLHLMEAYTRLLTVWPDAELRAALHGIVDLMLTRILDARSSHLGLFFTADWQPTTREISYGHDIEAAWLLGLAAAALGDPDLSARVRTTSLRIAEATLAEGMDAEGGIAKLGGPAGIIDATREWWPQAEAVVGWIDAWQVSGDERFLAAAGRTWDFIERHLIDRANGEWFRGVTRGGAVIASFEKAGFWKCPYHNGRMGLEIVRRLG